MSSETPASHPDCVVVYEAPGVSECTIEDAGLDWHDNASASLETIQ